nr:bacillithiol biosynthesis deacetylase BshB1 [Aureibacillus halotolerans]
MKLTDVLAIGAHPDDVEIGMGGAIATWAAHEIQVHIVDLTEGEMSSNGTVETRRIEASRAAEVLGATRENAQFPDRGLQNVRTEALAFLVELIRTQRPKAVFAPFPHDRHPDHAHASSLVKEAVFSAGIQKFAPDAGRSIKGVSLYYYMINGFHNPDFVVDIGSSYEKKKQSLLAYTTQFGESSDVQTPLTYGYLEALEGRDRLMGKEVGLTFAEGFLTEKPLLFSMDMVRGGQG